MNYLIGSDWQKKKAQMCDVYRGMLHYNRKIAAQSKRCISDPEDYQDVMENLSVIATLIDWEVVPGLKKRDLLELTEAAKGNVTLRRLMGHEDPESMYFLVMALMRGHKEKLEMEAV